MELGSLLAIVVMDEEALGCLVSSALSYCLKGKPNKKLSINCGIPISICVCPYMLPCSPDNHDQQQVDMRENLSHVISTNKYEDEGMSAWWSVCRYWPSRAYRSMIHVVVLWLAINSIDTTALKHCCESHCRLVQGSTRAIMKPSPRTSVEGTSEAGSDNRHLIADCKVSFFTAMFSTCRFCLYVGASHFYVLFIYNVPVRTVLAASTTRKDLSHLDSALTATSSLR